MKITVTSGRKDDIIRDRDDWDARNNEQKAKHDEQYGQYEAQLREIFNDIKQQVLGYLSGVKIALDVKVDLGRRSFTNPGVRVGVECEQHNVHGEDKALSWNWEVELDKEGNVNKESSSWSGLQATTSAQINHLKESVNALEILNGIDWNYMLTVTLPDYKEIVTEQSGIGQRPNFESDLFNAELEELVGTRTLVKGKNERGGNVWFNILNASAKQYKIIEIAGYIVDDPSRGRGETVGEILDKYIQSDYATRISKEKFEGMLKKPIQTMEV